MPAYDGLQFGSGQQVIDAFKETALDVRPVEPAALDIIGAVCRDVPGENERRVYPHRLHYAFADVE